MTSSKKNTSFIGFAFLFAVSVVYVLLEVILNISLVNLYSNPIANIFSDPEIRDQAKNIELYGRLISGFGLTLFAADFLYTKVLEKLPIKNVILSRPSLNLPLKGAFFLIVWIAVVLFLRIAVEAMIFQTSEKTKLDSVRVVMFKELYGSGTIDFPDLPVLNEAHKDPQQKKILTALIPSLAYMSASVNKSINDKTDEIGAFFLSARELKKYEKDVYPILKKNKKTADNEFDLYVKEIKNYEDSNLRLRDATQYRKFRDSHLNTVNSLLEKRWEAYDKDVSGISQYSLNMSKKLFDTYRYYDSLYVDKKCSWKKYAKRCETAVFRPWRQVLAKNNLPLKDYDFWFGASWYQLAKMLVLFVPTIVEDVSCEVAGMKNSKYCGKLKSEFTGLDNKFRVVRSEQLVAKYHFGLELDRADFLKESAVQRIGANSLRKKGIMVSTAWTTTEKRSLDKAVRNYLQKQSANIQSRYNKNSMLDLPLSARAINSRNEFYQNKRLQSIFKKRLGKYYYKGYLPQHTNAHAFSAWRSTKSQTNLDIVKMLTYKAEYGFKPGGIFYHLGTDAVKFTVIPTVSIALSAIGVLLIVSKLFLSIIRATAFGQQKTFGVKRWNIAIPFVVLTILAVPIINNHYMSRLSSGLLEADADSWTDAKVIKTYGLGYVLDAETNLFHLLGDFDLDIFSNIPQHAFDNLKKVENIIFDQVAKYLHFMLPLDEVKDFDLNIVLYRKQYDILMAMGLEIQNGEVERVAIPAILANKELDMLLDAKMFIGPNDYRELFITSLKDAKSPEFWSGIAQSDALRKSMRYQIESNLLKYIQRQYPKGVKSFSFLPKGVEEGNVVLVNHTRNRYTCYYLPNLNFTNLASVLSGFDINTIADKYRCQWNL